MLFRHKLNPWWCVRLIEGAASGKAAGGENGEWQKLQSAQTASDQGAWVQSDDASPPPPLWVGAGGTQQILCGETWLRN